MNNKIKRSLVRLYFFATGLGVSLVLSGTLLVWRSVAATSNVPTTTLEGAAVPDWDFITFNSLPGMNSSGSFQVNSRDVGQLGYDPSRQWNQGENPSNFLALGDFQDSFRLQNFDLSQIAQITGADVQSIGLDKLGVMPQQTLDSLVKAVPNLGDFQINQIEPVLDLIGQTVGSFDEDKTLNQLLTESPQLGNISFAGFDLSRYKIGDIPNLDVTQLGAFKDWQATKIQEIPGLSDVPFASFPNSPQAKGSTVGIVDVVFGAAEHQLQRSISGSTKEGFGVPCEQGCGHIELSGDSVLGRQWESGKYQEVKGGEGVLAAANGGKEPTGRHPFGSSFKLVVWDVSEQKGTASLAMFFRFCSRGMVDLGCTPYFIGPVPLMSVKEGDPIFLGFVGNDKSSTPSTPTPIALQELQQAQFELQSGQTGQTGQLSSGQTGQTGTNSPFLLPGADCNRQYGAVSLDALSSALTAIESDGNLGAVGIFTCDTRGNCGRALGDKQFMSYRSDVRAVIGEKPGGTDFLKELDSGKAITSDQLLQYFDPKEQQQLFNDDQKRLIDIASSQIDPTTGQLFTGERLIERIAQMHFGGVAVPIDSGATDANGQTVQAYGTSVASSYGQTASAMGCN